MNERVGLQISLVPDGDGVKAMVTGTAAAFDDLSKRGATAARTLNSEFGATRRGIISISQQLAQTRTDLLAFFSIRYAADQAQQLIALADTAKTLDARLKLATTSAQEHATAQAELFRISQQNRTALATNVDLYAKLAPSMREMGRSQQDVFETTSLVSQAMQLSGSSAAAADAAITQFAQAMASGVLRGDEFNSINEQGARLMQALADGLGVTRGELRGVAEQGKLTADVVLYALGTQQEKLRTEFDQLPLTVSAAMTQVHNQFMAHISDLDQTYGVTSKVAEGVAYLGNHMEELAAVVALVAANMGGRLVSSMAATVAAQARMVAAEIATQAAKTSTLRITLLETQAIEANARATYEATTGFARLAAAERLYAAQKQTTIAADALAAASSARLSGAVGVLGRGLGLLGGPAGIIATAVTGIMLWRASADSAASETARLADETNNLNKTMAAPAAQGYSRQVEQVKASIARASAVIAEYREKINLVQADGAGGNDARVEYFRNMIEVQQEKITGLKGQLDQLAETKKRIEGIRDKPAGKPKNEKPFELESADQYGQRMASIAKEAYPEATQSAEEYGVAQAAVAREWLQSQESAEAFGKRMADLAQQAYPEATQSAEEYGQAQSRVAQQVLAEMDQLRNQLMPTDAIDAAYQRRAQMIAENVASEQERNQLLLALEAQYQDEKIAIQQRGMTMEQKLWASGWEGKVQIAAGALGNVAQFLMAGNKRQFEIGKMLARASIIADTSQAVMKAWAQGGPFLGPTLAIAAAAQGALQLRNLNSTQFGSGGHVSTAGAGGGGLNTSIPSINRQEPLQNQNRTSGGVLQVSIYGGFSEQTLRDDVIPAIADLVNANDIQIVNINSRNGQDLIAAARNG